MDTASRPHTGTTARIRLGRTTTVRTAVVRIATIALAAAATIALLASTVGLSGAAAGASDRSAGPVATTITGGEADARPPSAALDRYRDAGLAALPAVAIHLHPGETGCRGNLGYYRAGRLDLCTAAASEPYRRKFALHELAHAGRPFTWTPRSRRVHGAPRARALEHLGRRLEGTGHRAGGRDHRLGAGRGETAPLLPEPATDAELAAAFELLTGEAQAQLGGLA
ncbi:MAG: hypothetical protein U0V56_12110 [Actinomycetota bacterium]